MSLHNSRRTKSIANLLSQRLLILSPQFQRREYLCLWWSELDLSSHLVLYWVEDLQSLFSLCCNKVPWRLGIQSFHTKLFCFSLRPLKQHKITFHVLTLSNWKTLLKVSRLQSPCAWSSTSTFSMFCQSPHTYEQVETATLKRMRKT